MFAGALASGGVVRGINAGARELPRSELDVLTELAKQHGAKGLVWAFVQEDGWRSPIAKFLTETEIGAVNGALDATPGDLLLIVADEVTTAGQALSALRLDLARRFELIPQGRHDILWVVEFPAFFWDPEAQRWDAAHHPFTAPTGDLDDPGSLRSRAYDLVLDGSEIGGGSIRIHRLDVQQRVFELLGIAADEAAGPVRVPARRAALRRAAARRDRDRDRPDRRGAGADGLDPRRDRLPEGGERRRPADRGAGTGRSRAAARAGPAARVDGRPSRPAHELSGSAVAVPNTGVMTSVSKPLIGVLLGAVVLFFAAVARALKPATRAAPAARRAAACTSRRSTQAKQAVKTVERGQRRASVRPPRPTRQRLRATARSASQSSHTDDTR